MWDCLKSAVRSRRRRPPPTALPPDHRTCRCLGLRRRPAAAGHVASPALGGNDPELRPTVDTLVAFFAAQQAALAAQMEPKDSVTKYEVDSFDSQGSQPPAGGPWQSAAAGGSSSVAPNSLPDFDCSANTDSQD